MKNQFICIIIFLATLYSQCDSYTSSECYSTAGCEWVENIDIEYCDGDSQEECLVQDECSWDLTYGGYLSFEWYYYCYGYYELDNSYCQEVEMPECTGMNQLQCVDESTCEWTEEISYGYCSNISWQQCENYSGCYVDSNPGWYDNSGPYCTGGTYVIEDNSYCEEIEILECSDLTHGPCLNDEGCEWVGNQDGYCQDFIASECDYINEFNCNNNDSCNWIDDYQWGSCSSLGSSSCDANPNCWGAYQYPGWYSGWYCAGGNYQIDNSYCQEVEFQLGDINGDSSINILDVIQIVNLILENEYSQAVDMNYDGNVNVLDIVVIVEIILGN